MKNVQIVDEAINTAYDIYQLTDEEFAVFFPEPCQNVEFIEDVIERSGDLLTPSFMDGIWKRRICKCDAAGIHGTLFYGLLEKKKFYPDKTEPPINGRLVD